jgi:hypothetical protein
MCILSFDLFRSGDLMMKRAPCPATVHQPDLIFFNTGLQLRNRIAGILMILSKNQDLM